MTECRNGKFGTLLIKSRARNLKDADTFHEPNGKSVSGFNMVHTISLYEVCSKRYFDLEVQPGRLKNEFQAICNLMDRYAYGGSPIFIADRGFSIWFVESICIFKISGNVKFRTITRNKIVFSAKFF